MRGCGVCLTHTVYCDSAYCCAELSHQHDVCCLKQTCTTKGAARKYLTTVTDVMILNYAVGLEVARGRIPRACDLVNCLLTFFLYNYSQSRQNWCQTWVNSLVETFRMQSQGRQMNMLWCNKYFHNNTNRPLNTTRNRDIGRVKLNLKN